MSGVMLKSDKTTTASATNVSMITIDTGQARGLPEQTQYVHFQNT